MGSFGGKEESSGGHPRPNDARTAAAAVTRRSVSTRARRRVGKGLVLEEPASSGEYRVARSASRKEGARSWHTRLTFRSREREEREEDVQETVRKQGFRGRGRRGPCHRRRGLRCAEDHPAGRGREAEGRACPRSLSSPKNMTTKIFPRISPSTADPPRPSRTADAGHAREARDAAA